MNYFETSSSNTKDNLPTESLSLLMTQNPQKTAIASERQRICDFITRFNIHNCLALNPKSEQALKKSRFKDYLNRPGIHFELSREKNMGATGVVQELKIEGVKNPVIIKQIDFFRQVLSQTFDPYYACHETLLLLENKPYNILQGYGSVLLSPEKNSYNHQYCSNTAINSPKLGIIMEKAKGRNLSEFIDYYDDQSLVLSIEEKLNLTSSIAFALHKIHQAQIIHNDLKPENIFIEDNNGEIKAHIIDFDLSQTTPERQHQNNLFFFDNIKPIRNMLFNIIEQYSQNERKNMDWLTSNINKTFKTPFTLPENDTIDGTAHYLPLERVVEPVQNTQKSDLWFLGIFWIELICGKSPLDIFEETTGVRNCFLNVGYFQTIESKISSISFINWLKNSNGKVKSYLEAHPLIEKAIQKLFDYDTYYRWSALEAGVFFFTYHYFLTNSSPSKDNYLSKLSIQLEMSNKQKVNFKKTLDKEPYRTDFKNLSQNIKGSLNPQALKLTFSRIQSIIKSVKLSLK